MIIELLVSIILGQSLTFCLLSNPLILCQLLTFFSLPTYSMLAYVDGFALFPRKYTFMWPQSDGQVSGLSSEYHSCRATLQVFISSPHIHRYHSLYQVRKLSQHALLEIRVGISLNTVSYRQFIIRMFDSVSSDLLSTSYLHTLIVWSILLQILIILIRPCVCFLLIWPVLSLLAFFLLILLLSFLSAWYVEKTFKKWNSNFLQ